jgi:hypothetical protein
MSRNIIFLFNFSQHEENSGLVHVATKSKKCTINFNTTVQGSKNDM